MYANLKLTGIEALARVRFTGENLISLASILAFFGLMYYIHEQEGLPTTSLPTTLGRPTTTMAPVVPKPA